MVIMELQRKLPGLHFFKKVNGWAFLKANLGMIAYIVVIDYLLPGELLSRMALLCYVSFVAITGAIIYLILLLCFRAFTEEELAMLPFAAICIVLLLRLSALRDEELAIMTIAAILIRVPKGKKK